MDQNEQTSFVSEVIENPMTPQQERRNAKKTFSRFALSIKLQLLPTAKEGVPTILANAGMIVFIVISALLTVNQLLTPILNAAGTQ